jgi:predicted ATPase/DNA-binding winged helix-turn-helix (wHTH) protein
MTLASSAVVGAHLRFGEFELAPAARALWRSGAPVKLGSRAFDILIALTSRPGEILSKDELTEIVWRGAHVEETGVRVGISNLRKALGESGERYVTTVPGRGYCFVLEVSATTAGRSPQAEDKARLKPQRLPRQIARIVGREAVIDILVGALARHRLLSIVGPGGIGKTTVALAVVARASDAFDTIAFVDLSPIRDGHQLSSGVAAALGLNQRLRQDPIEEIAAAVQDRRVLVLFDNCEHLVDPVAGFVEDLLGRAPGVTALATTRELLRAAGEWVHQLAPLEVPPNVSTLSAQEARGYSAAALFEDRAALALGGYVLDDADAPYVAEICRRLDGIALAIELAAGRLASLGIRGLTGSLEDCFRILTHGRRTALPRHQTLRATFDWSYQLLSPEDQAALRRLSVFSGNITLEDAAAVIEGDRHVIEAVDRMASLVDRSLVVANPSERTPRYRLLETTKAYAQERLAEAGEADLYRRRHAEHVRAAFDRAQAERASLPVRDWLQAYSDQLGNIRAALDWAFCPDGDGAIGAALTAAAAPLWFHLSLLDEGMAQVERAIAWAKDQPSPDRRLMLQLYAVSNWPRAQAIGWTPSAAADREENLALAVELEDVDHQLQAIWALILACTNRGAAAESLAQADRFAALAPQSNDPQDQVIARRLRGKSLHFTGDFAGSRSETERMLELYQPRPSHLVRFQYDQRLTAQITLARTLWLQGCADQALALVERMITEAQALDHTLTLGAVVCDAACFIALWVGDMALAARYVDMLKAHTAPAYRGWHGLGDACEGDILIRQGHAEAGIARLEQAIASLRVGPFCIYNGAIEGVLAEGLLASGRIGEAQETVAQTLARCRRSGEGWCLAELMRIQALTLTACGLSTQAAGVLAEGLELARAQGALAWELRLSSTRAEVEPGLAAQDGLREVLGRVQEGFGTRDYRTALARLDR